MTGQRPTALKAVGRCPLGISFCNANCRHQGIDKTYIIDAQGQELPFPNYSDK